MLLFSPLSLTVALWSRHISPHYFPFRWFRTSRADETSSQTRPPKCKEHGDARSAAEVCEYNHACPTSLCLPAPFDLWKDPDANTASDCALSFPVPCLSEQSFSAAADSGGAAEGDATEHLSVPSMADGGDCEDGHRTDSHHSICCQTPLADANFFSLSLCEKCQSMARSLPLRYITLNDERWYNPMLPYMPKNFHAGLTIDWTDENHVILGCYQVSQCLHCQKLELFTSAAVVYECGRFI